MAKLTFAEAAKRIHRNLTEFGYKVDASFVEGELRKLHAGEKPAGIIGMFAEDMLKKNAVELVEEPS